MLFSFLFFFFNDTATTEIYTLSLHDALPIFCRSSRNHRERQSCCDDSAPWRSEEHTSELQSRPHLVCRLLLAKKNIIDRAQNLESASICDRLSPDYDITDDELRQNGDLAKYR